MGSVTLAPLALVSMANCFRDDQSSFHQARAGEGRSASATRRIGTGRAARRPARTGE
jgi:hypothetical protein